MNKLSFKIAIIALASVIFLAGTGVTVMNFCCSGCYEQFVTPNNTELCHLEKELHACCNESQIAQHAGCQNHDLKKSCCSTERHSFDLDSFQHKPQVFNAFVWVTSLSPDIASVVPMVLKNYANRAKAPPHILPRTYLSLIRILII